MNVQYEVLTDYNYDELAWSIFRFVTSKEVLEELDKYPIYHDAECFWVIAICNNKIVGFSGARINSKEVKLKESYVVPEYRRKGIYARLFELREEYINKQNMTDIKITGVANKRSKDVFIRNGYLLKRETKNYYFFEKTL